MQRVVYPVLHTLLLGVAAPRFCVCILIGSLILISNVVSFPLLEASRLECKEVRQIIMNIDLIEPGRIGCVLRIVVNIGKLIYSTSQANRIFGDEPSQLRVIESRAIVLQTS